MKCTCATCQGTGEVACPKCDGDGFSDKRLGTIQLPKDAPHEVVGLKQDYLRCEHAARTLSEMNPRFSGSYQKQLVDTLKEIELQAERVMKKAKQ